MSTDPAPDAGNADALPDTVLSAASSGAEPAVVPEAVPAVVPEVVPEAVPEAVPEPLIAPEFDTAPAKEPIAAANPAQAQPREAAEQRDEDEGGGGDVEDAVEDAPAAPLRFGRLGVLLHKKSLIIAGAGITPVLVGAIAYLVLSHHPEPAAEAAPQQWTAAISTRSGAPAAQPPQAASPPADAALPAAEQTLEQQAAELAEVHKQLAEERARRIAAENSAGKLRLAGASHPAFSKPKAGPSGGKPSRRLEDCNVESGSFAATLKACIEEFNRMPQSRQGSGPGRSPE